MREFLRGLDLDPELIDTIMAEHGKLVTRDKEELQTLREEIKELRENSESAEELKMKYDELVKSTEEREAQQKAEEEDKKLTSSIESLFEGKTFTSDYAKRGLMNDIKAGLNNPENTGKGIQELFDELTKDKTDIFTNPNQIQDMESMGDSEQDNNTKDIPLIW